jgi:ribonuclease Y
MSIKLVLSLLALSGLAGIALGYVLRLLIALGQRGSLELEVKQRLLEARERANRIIKEAEEKAETVAAEHQGPMQEKEERLEKIEERVLRREEFLDESARKLSEQAELIRIRENEVANLRKEADKLILEEKVQLEKVANLTEDEAKKRLLEQLEKTQENTLLARLQKL